MAAVAPVPVTAVVVEAAAVVVVEEAATADTETDKATAGCVAGGIIKIVRIVTIVRLRLAARLLQMQNTVRLSHNSTSTAIRCRFQRVAFRQHQQVTKSRSNLVMDC